MDEIRDEASTPARKSTLYIFLTYLCFTALRAIRLLASYFSQPGNREMIETKFSSLMDVESPQETVLLCYAIFLQDDETGVEGAIRTCAKGMSLEL